MPSYTHQTVSTPEYSLETGGSMKLAWPRTMTAEDPISQKISATGDAHQSIGRPIVESEPRTNDA